MFFVMVFVCCLVNAQKTSSKRNFAFLINGREINKSISIKDMEQLCSLQIRFAEIDKTFDASHFDWVVNSGNELCSGDCSTEMLFPPEKYKTLKNGDVLIIDKLKIAEGNIDLPGQFTFVIQ